jgi:predicted nucleic acid-binding Zn ribbon protein
MTSAEIDELLADPLIASFAAEVPLPRVAPRRTCVGCGALFHGQSTARYCSDACRQRAYRERKRREER